MMRHLLCAAMICATSSCWVTDVTERDRLALLTARDFDAYGVHVPGPVQESYKRVNTIDGSYSLEYECNGAPPIRPYLAAQIDVERSPQAARVTMVAKRAAMIGMARTQSIGVRADSVELYGDESYFGSLMKDSRFVGNLVLVRRGRWVYTVVVAGLPLSSRKDWLRMLDSKFAHLDSITTSHR